MNNSLAAFSKQLDQLKSIETVEAAVAGLKVIADEAINLAPVETGFLRDSIEVTPDGELVVGAPYALDQEFGTYKMAAHPFIRPAIDNKMDAALKASAEVISKKMEAAIK